MFPNTVNSCPFTRDLKTSESLLDLKLNSLIKSINTIKDKNTRPKKVFFTDKFFHNENQKLDRVKSKKYALNLNKSYSLAKK